MSTKHTPGPWHVDRAHVVGPDSVVIVRQAAAYDDAQNDLRLIAASPDGLLAGSELLEVVQAAIANGDWKVDGRCDPDMAIHRMQAFIAKAAGAQP